MLSLLRRALRRPAADRAREDSPALSRQGLRYPALGTGALAWDGAGGGLAAGCGRRLAASRHFASGEER